MEWRFSRPNTISVAKRDAVARLDQFVGPKYWTPMHPQETVDRARALSEQGVFDREVALIVGVPLRTVRNWRTGRRRPPLAWSR